MKASKCYHDKLCTMEECTAEEVMPVKMPVMSMAAANMPAVCACCGATVCGAYIIARELQGKRATQLEYILPLNLRGGENTSNTPR